MSVYARVYSNVAAVLQNYPLQAIYPSKRPVVQAFTAQTAIKFIAQRSSASTELRSSNRRTDAQSSTFEGSQVAIGAGRNLTVTGSNIVSDTQTTLTAANNITITAAQNTSTSSNFTERRSSGLSLEGPGVFIGSRQNSNDQQNQNTTTTASTIGSTNGNVTIRAGGAYTQTGSDILAPALGGQTTHPDGSPANGNISIVGRSVSITEARETAAQQTEIRARQSGLTVSVGSGAVSAAQGAVSLAQAASTTSSGRMQLLGAAGAASGARDAYNAFNATTPVTPGNNPTTATSTSSGGAPTYGGFTVSASLGSSSSQSNSHSSANTARGSNVQGAGNVSITATGGDLTVQGSNIAADHTTSINATGNINLLASQNTTQQTSSSSSRSTSAGVSFGIGQGGAGPSFNIAASRGNSNGAGVEVTNTNSRVEGTRVNLNSGGNTTLSGAVVQGNTVNANVGGNLTITSLQDTSTFSEASRSQGGSMSFSAAGVPTGGSISSGRTAINSNFASVNEQSGIRTTDGGFNVNVGGATTLNGGQITSSQAAVDAARNTFNSTGGTTITDIQNTAAYNASGSNTTLGYTPTVTNPDGSTSGGAKPSAGFGSARGSASSTSAGGISGIAGNQAARTGDAGTGLAPIFNPDNVRADIQAQIQITQQAVPQLSRAVGDYAAGQMNDARRLQAQAGQLPQGDPRRAELERQANAIEANWGDQGVMRIGAHTLIGALAGGSGGAAGSAAGTISAPYIANGLQQLGITGPLANTLTTIASTGVGVLGGRATGTAGGGTSGGATALSEVTNNYLDHRRPAGGVRLSERERYDVAAADCAKGNPSACDNRDRLSALSGQRDEQLAQACSSPATGALCNDLRGQAAQMGNTVTTTPQGFTYANSPLQTPLNVSTIGPIPNPGANTAQTQIAQGVTDGLIGEVIGAPVGMAVGATVRGGRALVAEVRGGTGAAADVAGTGVPKPAVTTGTAAEVTGGARPVGPVAAAPTNVPAVVPPPNTYPVYPSGSGAATMPPPAGYTTVSRWVSTEEASLWLNTGGNTIPGAVPNNGTQLLYITQAGAPRPAGASGTVRIDFAVPNVMIQPGNTATNNLIIQPVQSTPIFGVQIHVPNGVRIPTLRR